MIMQRRNTKQRQIVLQQIQMHPGHFTAEEIYASIHETDPHISRGTVYRNLQLLADEEQIRRIQMPNASDCYERNLKDHDHLVCRICGKLVDVGPEDEEIDHKVGSMSHFSDVSHTFLFSGICPECQKKLKRKEK
jgi:Fur family ferric uptake transcriptional regulator/Fur family peroxide stress response transcriptional regulator